MLEMITALRMSYNLSKKYFTGKDNIWCSIHLMALVTVNLLQILVNTNLYSVQSDLMKEEVYKDPNLYQNTLSKNYTLVSVSLGLDYMKSIFASKLAQHLFISLSNDITAKWMDKKIAFTDITVKGGIGPEHIIAKDSRNFGYYVAEVITKFLEGVSTCITAAIRLSALDIRLLMMSVTLSTFIGVISSGLSKLYTKRNAIEEKNAADLYNGIATINQTRTHIASSGQNSKINEIKDLRKKVLERMNTIQHPKASITTLIQIVLKTTPGLGFILTNYTPINIPIPASHIEESGKHILGMLRFSIMDDVYTVPFLRTLMDRINLFNNEIDKILSEKRITPSTSGDDIKLAKISYSRSSGSDKTIDRKVIFNEVYYDFFKIDIKTKKPNIYKIIGSNGSGKTTLISFFQGNFPQSGELTFPESYNNKNNNCFRFISSEIYLSKKQSLYNSIFDSKKSPLQDQIDKITKSLIDSNVNITIAEHSLKTAVNDYIKTALLGKYFLSEGGKVLKYKERENLLVEIYNKKQNKNTKDSNEKFIQSVANFILATKIEKVKSLLNELGCVTLIDKINDSSTEASLGELQIIQLMQTLVSNPPPDFLFLDEVFSSIHIDIKQKICTMILRELPRTAIVYVDHNNNNIIVDPIKKEIGTTQSQATSSSQSTEDLSTIWGKDRKIIVVEVSRDHIRNINDNNTKVNSLSTDTQQTHGAHRKFVNSLFKNRKGKTTSLKTSPGNSNRNSPALRNSKNVSPSLSNRGDSPPPLTL